MDEIYDFSWIIDDIDESIIFMLRDGKGMLDTYVVDGLRINGDDKIAVKFANIMDITNFINYVMVRFVGVKDKQNIIDIPIRKLYYLYRAANEITEGVPKPLGLTELETFAIYDNMIVNRGYAIYPYKINEMSQDLKDVIMIAKNFYGMNMNKQIDALEDINFINFERSKNINYKGR